MSHALRRLAVVLAGVLVVTACTAAPDEEPTPPGAGTDTPAATPAEISTETAADLVLRLYDEDAVDEALDRVAERSVPEAIRDDVRGSFEAIFAREDVGVGATEEWQVDGVRIVEVDTSDGIRWCLRPDGAILIQCRVGVAPVEVDTGDVPVEVARAEVDVFPEEHQLRLQLRPEDQAVTFHGLITLTDRQGRQVPMIQTQAALASQGEIIAQADRDTTLRPGTTLLLAWVTDVGETLEQELRLGFGDDGFDIDIGQTEYFVR